MLKVYRTIVCYYRDHVLSNKMNVTTLKSYDHFIDTRAFSQ